MLITMLQKTPASYFAKLVEVLEQLGIGAEEFLSAANLNSADMRNRHSYIDLECYLAAVQRALEISQREDLGFLVGSHPDTLEQGGLGYALLSSNTLRESLSRYERYQNLLGSGLTVKLVVEGEIAKFKARPLQPRLALSRAQLEYFTQEWLAGWNRWAALIGEQDGFFEQVSLGFNTNRNPDVYTRHLKCRVNFGHVDTTAIFPSAYLDRALDFSNDSAAAVCVAYSDKLRLNLNTEQGVASEIHNCLLNSPGHIPNMVMMAETLGMSTPNPAP